jgi:transcriptional regulator of acetoin/glycerol metabolism
MGVDREMTIRHVLALESGCVTAAARRLTITREALWQHMRSLGIGSLPKRLRDEARRRFVVP